MKKSFTVACNHGLRTPREEIAFTERPKIHSHSQIFRYSRSRFCLPHRPNFSDIFDLCLHLVSVVCACNYSVKKYMVIHKWRTLWVLFSLFCTFSFQPLKKVLNADFSDYWFQTRCAMGKNLRGQPTLFVNFSISLSRKLAKNCTP